MRPASSWRVRPSGLTYRADFISVEEEHDLRGRIEELAFQEVRMHGVAARRTTIHCGWSYEDEGWKIERTPPPEWLEILIARCADAAGIERDVIQQVMIARYPAMPTDGGPLSTPASPKAAASRRTPKNRSPVAGAPICCNCCVAD